MVERGMKEFTILTIGTTGQDKSTINKFLADGCDDGPNKDRFFSSDTVESG